MELECSKTGGDNLKRYQKTKRKLVVITGKLVSTRRIRHNLERLMVFWSLS